MFFSSGFRVDPEPVQQIRSAVRSRRFEGIAFSSSGNSLAIATSESNEVLLFQRVSDRRFAEVPYRVISRSASGLDYPHDVSFSTCGARELLAVAQRAGAILIYERSNPSEDYCIDPVCEISGPRSKLEHSDGVAFVQDHIAACNLTTGTISFFRRKSECPIQFDVAPEFELRHPSIVHPDGLAFSNCGSWLAVANHGQHSVAIFERANRRRAGDSLRFGPDPIAVIKDSKIRYPHSVAFTPRNHLIVTNAGANYFNVYAPRRNLFGMRWSSEAVSQVLVHDDKEFLDINMTNKMEGGPKGVAVYKNSLAVCSPQVGVKIYAFHES
jgi:hypothetical protein